MVLCFCNICNRWQLLKLKKKECFGLALLEALQKMPAWRHLATTESLLRGAPLQRPNRRTSLKSPRAQSDDTRRHQGLEPVNGRCVVWILGARDGIEKRQILEGGWHRLLSCLDVGWDIVLIGPEMEEDKAVLVHNGTRVFTFAMLLHEIELPEHLQKPSFVCHVCPKEVTVSLIEPDHEVKALEVPVKKPPPSYGPNNSARRANRRKGEGVTAPEPRPSSPMLTPDSRSPASSRPASPFSPACSTPARRHSCHSVDELAPPRLQQIQQRRPSAPVVSPATSSVTPQKENGTFERAIGEIRAGRKSSCWMWFVIPSPPHMKNNVEHGSSMNRKYAIRSDEEGKAFLNFENDGVDLRENYFNIINGVLEHVKAGKAARSVIGGFDEPKLASSIILFERLSRDEDKEMNEMLTDGSVGLTQVLLLRLKLPLLFTCFGLHEARLEASLFEALEVNFTKHQEGHFGHVLEADKPLSVCNAMLILSDPDRSAHTGWAEMYDGRFVPALKHALEEDDDEKGGIQQIVRCAMKTVAAACEVPCCARLFRRLGLEALQRFGRWAAEAEWTRHQWVREEAVGRWRWGGRWRAESGDRAPESPSHESPSRLDQVKKKLQDIEILENRLKKGEMLNISQIKKMEAKAAQEKEALEKGIEIEEVRLPGALSPPVSKAPKSSPLLLLPSKPKKLAPWAKTPPSPGAKTPQSPNASPRSAVSPTSSSPPSPRPNQLRLPIPAQTTAEQLAWLEGDLPCWAKKFASLARVEDGQIVVELGMEAAASSAAREELYELVEYDLDTGALSTCNVSIKSPKPRTPRNFNDSLSEPETVFHCCDTNGNGQLDLHEVKFALNAFGLFPSLDYLSAWMDGPTLSFDAFGKLLDAKLRSAPTSMRGPRTVPYSRRGIRMEQVEGLYETFISSGWLQQQCDNFNAQNEQAICRRKCFAMETNLYALNRWDTCAALRVWSQQVYWQISKPRMNDMVYWICLMALNQHRPGDEVGSSPEEGPFNAALVQSSCGAVMILDEKVQPFTRIWCLFEVKRLTDLNKDFHLISAKGAMGANLAAEMDLEQRRVLMELTQRVASGTSLVHWQLLHVAAYFGHTEAVEALVESKANLEAKTKFKLTPLHQAARNGQTLICEMLLDYKADLHNVAAQGRTCLQNAAHQGHRGVVELLLARRANPNIKDENGVTALHSAAASGHGEMVEVLLSSGADPFLRQADDLTVLHVASMRGAVEVAREIVEKTPQRQKLLRSGSTKDRGHAKPSALHGRVGTEACDSYWIRRLSREKLQKRLETGAHVVVKTHEWTGLISPKTFEEVKEVFSHVVVSVRENFDADPAWMKLGANPIKHSSANELVAYDKANPGDVSKIGALSVLRKLADHLNLTSLTDHDLRVVDYELMALPIPTWGCDQVTKHWPFHRRKGGRPMPPDPRVE
eukprot:g10583.t1